MSATNAWSLIAWMAGVVIGVGFGEDKLLLIFGGAVATLVAFAAIKKFGDQSG